MGAKSLRWFMFTVLIALLPFVFIYFVGNYETLWQLVNDKKADIVFMGVAFCAVGIGELLESATSNVTMPKMVTHSLLGFSIVVMVWSTLLYAGISSGKADTISIMHICFIFGASVICSTGCIALSEFTEKRMIEQQLATRILESKKSDGNEIIQMISERADISPEGRHELIIAVCKKLKLSLQPEQIEQVFTQSSRHKDKE